MSEKPLHVRVAEALGWTDLHSDANRNGDWGGTVPVELDHLGVGGRTIVYRYDLDWSATGPLIEAHGICLTREDAQTAQDSAWSATKGDGFAGGATPLLAVCNLFEALAAAGKLTTPDASEVA